MALLGIWTGGVIGSKQPGTSWAAPDGLFPTETRNDSSTYTWASATSQVTLPSSGLADGYLFVGAFEFEDSSNGRHNPQARIIKQSGTGTFVGPASSGFNRDNSEDRSYVRCWGFVDNPSASSTYRFQWKRDSDAPGATDGTVRSEFVVVPLYYADVGLYSSTSASAYGGTTVNQVTGFSGTDGTNITLTSNVVSVTGDNKAYLILGGGYMESVGGGDRTQRWMGLRVDGTKVDQAKAYSYYRNAANDNGGDLYTHLIETVTATRTIDTFCYRGDGVSALQGGADVDGSGTPANGSWALVVLELNDTAEYFIGEDGTGGDDIAVNGTSDINVSRVADFSESGDQFSRASDVAVDVAAATDVLLGANISAASNGPTDGSRFTTYGELTKNGTEIARTVAGDYGRGNQSSQDCFGWSANILSVVDVAAGDDVGVSTTNLSGSEAASDDWQINAGWAGFWGIDLDTLEDTGGAKEVTGAHLSSGATLYAPTVIGPQSVTGGTVASGASVNAPAWVYPASSGDTFLRSDADKSETSPDNDLRLRLYGDKDSGSLAVTAGTVASGSGTYAPTVAPGAAAATGAHVASTAATAAPSAAYRIAAAVIASALSLFAPTVAPGAAAVTGSHVSSSAATYAPAVDAGAVSVTGAHIGAGSVEYGPSVSPGAVSVVFDGPPVVFSQTLYAPSVAVGGTAITAGHVSSSASTAAPTVAPGAVEITGPHATAGGPSGPYIYPPTVAVGGTAVTAGTVSSGAAVYPPDLSVEAVSSHIATTANLYPPALAHNVEGPHAFNPDPQRWPPSLAYSIAGAYLEHPAGGGLAQRYPPTVAAGAVEVTGAHATLGGALYPPAVAAGGTSVTGAFLAAGSSLAAPSLSTGSVEVTAGTVAASSTTYAPSVAPGAVAVIGAAIVPGPPNPAFGAPELAYVVAAAHASSGGLVYPPALSTVTAVGAAHVPSGAALYPPAVSSGAVVVLVPHLAGAGALYPPALDVGAVTVVGAHVGPGSLYPPALSLAVAGASVASTVAVAPPAVTPGAWAVAAATVTGAPVLHAPTVTVGAVGVTGAHVGATAAFYAPSISVGSIPVTGATVGAGSAVYPPSLAVGAVEVTAGTVAAGSSPYPPAVAAGAIPATGAHVSSSATLNPPDLAYLVVTAAHGAGASVTAPSVTTTTGAAGAHVAPGGAVYPPTVAAGAVAVTAAHVAGSSALYPPSLDVGAVSVLGAHVAGTVLTPPAVSTGYAVGGAFLTASSSVYPPAVAPGAASATGAHVPAASSLYPPSIATVYALTGGHVASSVAPYAPTVVPGAVSVVGGTVAAPASLYAPAVTVGDVEAGGAHVAAGTAVYPPLVSTGGIVVVGGHVASGSSPAPPAVAPGAVEVTTPAPAAASSLYPPAIGTDYAILGPHAAPAGAVYPPSLEVGAVEVVSGTVAASGALYPPSLGVGATEITAGHVSAGPGPTPPAVAAGGYAVTAGHVAASSSLAAPSVAYGVETAHRASTAALYAPGADLELSTAFVAPTATPYAPEVIPGAVSVVGAPVGPGAAVFEPSVGSGVGSGHVGSSAAPYGPAVAYVVALPTVASSLALNPPTVEAGFTLVGAFVPGSGVALPPELAYVVQTAFVGPGVATLAPEVAPGLVPATGAHVPSTVTLEGPLVWGGAINKAAGNANQTESPCSRNSAEAGASWNTAEVACSINSAEPAHSVNATEVRHVLEAPLVGYVPEVEVWLKPGDWTTSAGLITQWNDSSGNGYHYTNADPDPNTRPQAKIDAAGNDVADFRYRLANYHPYLSDPRPVFSVYRKTLLMIGTWESVPRSEYWCQFAYEGGSNHDSNRTSGFPYVLASGSSAVRDDDTLHTLNGVAFDVPSVTYPNGLCCIVVSHTKAGTQLYNRLGGYGGVFGGHYGDWHEFMLLDKTLTESEAAAYSAWLLSRYPQP